MGQVKTVIRDFKQTDAAVNRQIFIQLRVIDVKDQVNSLGLESFWRRFAASRSPRQFAWGLYLLEVILCQFFRQGLIMKLDKCTFHFTNTVQDTT